MDNDLKSCKVPSPPPQAAGGLAAIHTAVLLFGFSGLFGKFLTINPVVIVFGRTFFAAAALLPVLLLSRKVIFKKKEMGVYFCQGILLAVHWSSFFYAIQISTVALGLLTFSTFPLFVTFMEPFFFKEKLLIQDIAAAIIVFAGLVLVIPGFDFSKALVQGAFFGIFSGITFAGLAIVNRKNVQTSDPLAVAFNQNLFAAAALFPVLVLISPATPEINDIFLLAVLGIVCTALAHSLFIKSLIHIKAQTAGIITALEPVYGIVLAFILLNEQPSLKTAAGGVLIISATTMAMHFHKQKTRAQPG